MGTLSLDSKKLKTGKGKLCGVFGIAAQFVLDANEQATGGWVIQKITIDFEANGCCENSERYGASAPCPVFATDDPAKSGTLVYWEATDFKPGQARNGTNDVWGYPSGIGFFPSWGKYSQSGNAWFSKKLPNANWQNIPGAGGRIGLTSCEEPKMDNGDPAEPGPGGDVINRKLALSWDCCATTYGFDGSVTVTEDGQAKPVSLIPDELK